MLDGSVFVALGLILALIFDLLATPNRAGIPLRLVGRRAAPGILLFLVFWFFIAAPFVAIVFPMANALTCVMLGVLFPQLSRIKDALLSLDFAKRFPNVAAALQYFDETIQKYFQGIVNREERRVTYHALEQNPQDPQDPKHGKAIDRLYEHYLMEIMQEQAALAPKKRRHRASQLRQTGHQVVKCRLLLRLLGYSDFLHELKKVSQNPEIILPTWPSHAGNRRKRGDRRGKPQSHVPERRNGFGRRQLDDPGVVDLLISGNKEPRRR